MKLPKLFTTRPRTAPADKLIEQRGAARAALGLLDALDTIADRQAAAAASAAQPASPADVSGVGPQTRAALDDLKRARLRKGVREVGRARHQVHGLPSDAELADALHLAVEALDVPSLSPHAGFPPRLSPELWAASCKGGEHRRCGACELCEWERSAQLWAAVSPWNRAHKLDRLESAPRWPSLAAALLAAVEFERRNRCGPSALGGILDRLKRGESGSDARDPRKTDPSAVVAAMDIVHVQSALERAYPTADNDNAALSPVDCARVLLARTAGVLASVTSYEALTQQYGVSEGTLRAIVKQGRERITEDLAARGLIPYPRPRARVAETLSTMRANVDDELPSFDREAAHA